jgi:hypothetical protein
MAIRLHHPQYRLDIGAALLRRGQEMKNRAVVPDVDGMTGQIGVRDIRRHPVDRVRRRAEPCPGDRKRRFREIKHGECRIALPQQIVDQRRRSAADIQHRCRSRQAGLADEAKGTQRVVLKPAHALGGNVRVDLLPVRPGLH